MCLYKNKPVLTGQVYNLILCFFEIWSLQGMFSSDADRLLQCRLRHIVNEVYDPEVTIEVKEILRNIDEFLGNSFFFFNTFFLQGVKKIMAPLPDEFTPFQPVFQGILGNF